MRQSRIWQIIAPLVVALILGICPRLHAVTFLSGPTFTPATNAPLAGVLQLTTDVPSRIGVLASDGTNVWEKDFYDFATAHSETLLGFKPGKNNLILVTVYDKYRNSCTAPQLLEFDTAPLPSDFPVYTVMTNEPDMMEPGYTLFLVNNGNTKTGYATIMDNLGEVVWYMKSPGGFSDDDIRQLDNGDLFIVQPAQPAPFSNNFLEVNLLGQTVKTLTPPPGYPIDLHDGVPTDHGTILYLSDITRSVTNFPINYAVSNSPLGTASVEDTPAVEISATNSTDVLNVWSPVDLLDPTRITYLTSGNVHNNLDNEHGNAVLEDTNDNSIIISLRNQNTVFKISRTGQLKWILGPTNNWSANFQPYLLTPVGTNFEWNYGQHCPTITPQGTLMLYDDGNNRASPWEPPVADTNNYSRAVEYRIDETNMTVSQVWDTMPAVNDRLFTPAVGSAYWLPERRNVLVNYGLISYINGIHPNPSNPGVTAARIVEYTHDPTPQIVFEISFFNPDSTGGYLIYRSRHISDLYAHPVSQVIDVVVSRGSNGSARLEFSADPNYTYNVQASTDLIHWTTIGTAEPDAEPGDFELDDLFASEFTIRFYRVVAQ